MFSFNLFVMMTTIITERESASTKPLISKMKLSPAGLALLGAARVSNQATVWGLVLEPR